LPSPPLTTSRQVLIHPAGMLSGRLAGVTAPGGRQRGPIADIG
jgi:hypothetical protein